MLVSAGEVEVVVAVDVREPRPAPRSTTTGGVLEIDTSMSSGRVGHHRARLLDHPHPARPQLGEALELALAERFDPLTGSSCTSVASLTGGVPRPQGTRSSARPATIPRVSFEPPRNWRRSSPVGSWARSARAELAEALPRHSGQWPCRRSSSTSSARRCSATSRRACRSACAVGLRGRLLGTGICGALTTFSTVQGRSCWPCSDDGDAGLAAVYAGVSIAVGFATMTIADELSPGGAGDP
jgi:hypothetical protein